MAVGSYYDVYTVPEYEGRVTSIADSINELRNGGFFIEAESRVREQIALLEKKEADLISKLNIPGVKTLADLNLHLEQYKRTTFKLSGSALIQTFTGILEERNAKEFDIFNQIVMAKIDELAADKEIEERGYDYLYDLAMEYLNTGLASSKGIDTSFRSRKGYTQQGIFPASFTSAQKKRWKKLIAQETKPKNIDVDQWELELFSSGNTSFSASFNWFDTTKRMTQTEAKKLDSKEVDEINRQIKQAILAQTGDVQLMGKIIDHVLSESGNRFAFFVGKNVNDITGILGEIQGLYFLSKLYGGANATDIPKGVSWRGGTYTGDNSSKPHQDILFETFGIQVKNSTKDLVGSVSFANASIETILAKTGISESAKNVFYNYYGTKEFNIPYHREGNKYEPGLRETDINASRYKSSRDELLSYEKDIEELLSLFAASFMYMDISDNFSLEDANVLYLIGGSAFRAASQILQEVLDNLRTESKNFRVKSSITLGNNIIDALNSGASKKADYSSAMIKNVKLTSSYKF